MGFLDNSGDIILDAVLTDAGRKRQATGNFKVDKFALFDDEIDYGLYDKTNVNGSAYYDIQILQTPILEAFTNNMSGGKYRLLTLTDNDVLFLPVLKLFVQSGLGSELNANGSFVIPVDKNTVESGFGGVLGAGILNGYRPADDPGFVRIDQGLNTTELAKEDPIDDALLENQYIVQLDGKLGAIYPTAANTSATTRGGVIVSTSAPVKYAFRDDDGVDNYVFTGGRAARGFIRSLDSTEGSSIQGPRGSSLAFRLGASLDLRNSIFLFNQIGSVGTATIGNSTVTDEDNPGTNLNPANTPYRFIDSTARISGLNTGYSIDVPLRFVKLT